MTDPLSRRSRIGPFALEAPLGGELAGGADSNVLRGVHLELKRSMAVKLIDPAVVKDTLGGNSFMEDVRRLQKLEHPRLVRLLGGAIDGGQPYLALELVEGESLAELLERRGKLAWEPAVEIAQAIGEGLVYLHSKQVVHRRLTPAHVLLPTEASEEGEIGLRITGLDATWADRDEVLGLRSPMSKAHYLSPEQFRGRKSKDLPACDLFSLGVILYRCLTGVFPWPADTPEELIEARRIAPAARVSATVLDAPVWLDALVKNLLAVKRSERFATAEEAHRAIVNARRKVAAGVGAAAHGWSGKQGGLSVDDDSGELKRIRRKKTRKKDDSPFYERAWFLALCLTGLIGVGTWTMMPDSEAALFAKAQPLMASDDPSDWEQADSLYLDELRERFPQSEEAPSEYTEQLVEFDLRLEMFRAMRKVENPGLSRRSKQSEAQRRFADALRYEEFGDRLSAWQKFEAVSKLFSKSEELEDRAFAKLAEEHARAIAADRDSQSDLTTLIEGKIAEAARLIDEGKRLEARRLLSGIESLYGENREQVALVELARERLRDLDAGS
ncbi:serine/threonine-protein kinase [Adhaeretor mobilis]|uniref:Serine/threonine-protein kinase PknL n=1 Tax=Adhaeretor mobilis TaxID=1930276 RepID=A0A517MPN3_9BACT|nr:serine/threonine-protein kinase [Adhaeretor mobilis]QDS96839.1 Serine/threonine-protein kinase PknL [Adhaeretor mobilis]